MAGLQYGIMDAQELYDHRFDPSENKTSLRPTAIELSRSETTPRTVPPK